MVHDKRRYFVTKEGVVVSPESEPLIELYEKNRQYTEVFLVEKIKSSSEDKVIDKAIQVLNREIVHQVVVKGYDLDVGDGLDFEAGLAQALSRKGLLADGEEDGKEQGVHHLPHRLRTGGVRKDEEGSLIGFCGSLATTVEDEKDDRPVCQKCHRAAMKYVNAEKVVIDQDSDSIAILHQAQQLSKEVEQAKEFVKVTQNQDNAFAIVADGKRGVSSLIRKDFSPVLYAHLVFAAEEFIKDKNVMIENLKKQVVVVVSHEEEEKEQ